MAFGFSDRAALTLSESPAERRLALQAVKQRLYHATFREAVITATKEDAPSQGCWSPCCWTLRTLLRITMSGPAVR